MVSLSRLSLVLYSFCVFPLTTLAARPPALSPRSPRHPVPQTHPSPENCENIKSGYTCDTNISRRWGPYTPWYSLESQISPDVPKDCKITFAQLLSRHGARYPHADETEAMAVIVEQIQKSVPASAFTGKYAFLKSYKFDLGVEDLTAFGAQQLRDSGTDFVNRYSDLVKQTPRLFVRASSEQRVIDSATNFTEAYYAAQGSRHRKMTAYYPEVVLSETSSLSNNTLCPQNTCPTLLASTTATDKSDIWAASYLPAPYERINADLPGANLSLTEMMILMDFCPFETVATANGTPSPFCNLFTAEEWAQYDYFGTVYKYYGYGQGNPLGPSQGVGWSNELIARLTQQEVQDHTTVNHTLDDRFPHATFPRANKLYADFTHEEALTAVMWALGLYNSTPAVSSTEYMSAAQLNGYTVSRTVPFGARLVVEKMQCECEPEEELVRVLVNDAVVPLSTCRGVDSLGRCALSSWLESLSFVRSGGFWSECDFTGANYTLPSDR